MSRWLAPILLAAVSCAGSGYSERADCEETFACCEELGEPVEGFDLDQCIQDTTAANASLTDDELQTLDDIFSFCQDQGFTGCAFFECLSGSAPTTCPAEFIEKTPTNSY